LQEPVTAILLIQQALTPVFLIVGIGTLLNSITQRLSRIVDRVRWFDLPEAANCQYKKKHELKSLSRRMRWANGAVNFLCGATVLVCVNIFLLVFNGYYYQHLDQWIVASFTSSLVLLACGLICFFIEVSIATASLRVSDIPEGTEDE
jgi:hypothetical protein